MGSRERFADNTGRDKRYVLLRLGDDYKDDGPTFALLRDRSGVDYYGTVIAAGSRKACWHAWLLLGEGEP
jgi:hypothetical protein